MARSAHSRAAQKTFSLVKRDVALLTAMDLGAIAANALPHVAAAQPHARSTFASLPHAVVQIVKLLMEQRRSRIVVLEIAQLTARVTGILTANVVSSLRRNVSSM
jgi:hypothetical protein